MVEAVLVSVSETRQRTDSTLVGELRADLSYSVDRGDWVGQECRAVQRRIREQLALQLLEQHRAGHCTDDVSFLIRTDDVSVSISSFSVLEVYCVWALFSEREAVL